ncbi:hypothetical protein VNO80_19189 [Phaseolus coccineus]|uniref:Uncharacterized protein n=1 Tax=Phaseolus coccineus TaxID=3886 RepID=A0AAN9MLR7_PHACN
MAQAFKKKASSSAAAEAFVAAVGKNNWKGKNPPISDPEYSWILEEGSTYDMQFSLKVQYFVHWLVGLLICLFHSPFSLIFYYSSSLIDLPRLIHLLLLLDVVVDVRQVSVHYFPVVKKRGYGRHGSRYGIDLEEIGFHHDVEFASVPYLYPADFEHRA